MEHPLLKKLAEFVRCYRLAILFFFLEVSVITVTLLFCVAESLDYLLWRHYFVDLFFVTKTASITALFSVLALSFLAIRIFLRAPKTPREGARFLRKAQALANAKSPQTSHLPDSLESAIDFLEKSNYQQISPETSCELCDAVIEKVWEKFRHLSLEEFLPAYARKKMLRIFGISCIILYSTIIGFCAWQPSLGTAAMTRFFTPWKKTFWPLQAKIQWKDFQDEILFGNDFNAEILIDKEISRLEANYWEISTPQADGTKFSLCPIDGRFYIRLRQPPKTFQVSVNVPGQNATAPDTRTVVVYTRPILKDARIRIFPPEYTQQSEYDGSWQISGLYGTRVGMLLTADRPLKRARLLFENGTFIPGSILADQPHRCLFAMQLFENTAYRIELMDAQGLTSELETHSMTLEADCEPDSTCLVPANGRTLLPNARIPIRISGKDDYGLRGLGFRWVIQDPNNTKSEIKTKWTNFNLWSSPPTETPAIRRTVNFSWDLTSLQLQPGAQIRIEPVVQDTANAQTYGSPIFLKIVTPEEMTSYANLRWRAIYQEIQNLDNVISSAQNSISSALAGRTSQEETVSFLQALLADIARAGNERDSLSLLYSFRLFEEDLRDNPEFFFQNSTTSKDLEKITARFSLILDSLFSVRFPQLRKLILDMNSDIQIQEHLQSISRTLEEIHTAISPFLLQMKKDETAAQSKRTFHEIVQAQSELSRDIIQSVTDFDSCTFPFSSNPYPLEKSFRERQWEILSKVRDFSILNSEDIPDSARNRFLLALQNQVYLAFEELGKYRLSEIIRTQNIVLETFAKYERLYSPEVNTDSRALEKISVQIQDFQTQILEMLESFSTDAEESAMEKIFFSRKNRMFFLRFAELQRTFAQNINGTEARIPAPLQASIFTLSDNLSLSASNFEMIASGPKTTREILDDQFSLQLLLFDEVTAICKIYARISENSNEFSTISDLENKAKSEVLETNEDSMKAQLTSEDILILRSMQELVYEQTESLADPDLSPEILSEQISFLKEDQQKIVLAATESGLNSKENPVCMNIFTQINQVDFLFSQQNIGKMNLDVQREIIYNLSGLLRKKNEEDSTLQIVQQESSESLSENADSQAAEIMESASPSEERNASRTSASEIPESQKAFWVELPKERQRELDTIPKAPWIPGYEKMIDLYYHHLRN